MIEPIYDFQRMSLNHTILSARRPKLETRTKRISTSRRGPPKRRSKKQLKNVVRENDVFWPFLITFWHHHFHHHFINHHFLSCQKSLKNDVFWRGPKMAKKRQKRPKMAQIQKPWGGYHGTPKIVIFRQNYIREKPQKVVKSAKNRPFFGVPKPPKIDLFWPHFFDVDVIVTLLWRYDASHRNFFSIVITHSSKNLHQEVHFLLLF